MPQELDLGKSYSTTKDVGNCHLNGRHDKCLSLGHGTLSKLGTTDNTL